MDPDLPLRLDRTPYLWNGTSRDTAHTLTSLAVLGIEQLYNSIIESCHPTPGCKNIIAPVTVQELRATFPRPSSPEVGILLGVPLPAEPETEKHLETHRRGGQ